MQANAIPDTPTEPDWPAYTGRLENEIAGLTVENLRLAATVDTLSAHVTELRAAMAAAGLEILPTEASENDGEAAA
jgi:hypothetical protein